MDEMVDSNDTKLFASPSGVASGTKKRVRKLQEKWTSQQTQKLIQEVEAREGTWNFLVREYKDRNLRESLWQEVADVMGLPRSEVATKWNSLRCSFRAIFNKMGQKKRGKEAAPNPLYSSLKFLEPTLQIEAPTTSNLINKCASPSVSSISTSDTEDLEPDDQESTSKASAKRRRVEKNDDEYVNVVERALNTIIAAAKHDVWDDLGNFVSSNGREWAAENFLLAKEFKLDINELILNYQKKLSRKADIALIGLAVMGQNLILNMDSKGFVVCAYNRTVEKVTQFLKNEAKGTKVIGANSLQDMVDKLKTPRKIMLLVKAGSAVDDFIQQLVPLLSPGDLIIDGGNSEYQDTARRCDELRAKGFLYVGSGVSGGEEGARYGPSLMPGGHPQAWPLIQPIFQAICAQADGEPCCEWVGEGGAGHFVKMVHNGIEYGDMQLICEAYHIMKSLGLKQSEMAEQFGKWNSEELDSFLIEITRDILKYKDDKGYLLERIRDTAGQKGTGKWTAIAALQYGVPVTLIGEAVFSRCLSALQSERVHASTQLNGPTVRPKVDDLPKFLNHIKHALYCAKIVSYAQGFMLMREAAKENKWNLNYGGIALMWRGGCIIRSVFLGNIKEAFTRNPQLSNLLLDDFFKKAIEVGQNSWRQVVANAFLWGIPVPALSTALSFYDGYRTEKLPANLLQAQRDYFGAHTYELLGQEGKFVHTNWTGTGGNVSASTYQA